MGEIENLDTLDNETSRFADYFVICGLDLHSGLELDRLAGWFSHAIYLYQSFLRFSQCCKRFIDTEFQLLQKI